MLGLTKRNLIAILIIVIAFVTVSLLAWLYLPIVVFCLILVLGAFSLAVYVALNPPGTTSVRTGAGRYPATRIMATAGGPPPARQAPAREAPPRPAARRGGRGAGRGSDGQAAVLPPDALVALTEERAAAGVDEVVAGLDRTL